MFKKKSDIPLSELCPSVESKHTREKYKLEDFELAVTLGTGTFGRVRLVKHLPSGDYMALKILKKSEILRLKQVEHIKSEVKILNKIHQPFIVNLLGFFQDEYRLYLVLEYVPGGELFTYLRREGKISEDFSRYYIAQLVIAFSYLHGLNIIYRDLKPENLLISSKGQLKITDFGFAKEVEDRTWTLCGTPEYLAPEIIQSRGHGKSVDWWALGILLYEMLAGYPPFFDENPFGIYQKILAGKLEFPRYVDGKAKDLIKKLLIADRTKRLGCLRHGAEDVRKHKFFNKFDWEGLMDGSIVSPYIPVVKGPGDHGNFDPYPDSPVGSTPSIRKEENATFDEFNSF